MVSPVNSPREMLKGEMLKDTIYSHSREVAKFEFKHLCPLPLDPKKRLYQILPPLKGPHSVGHTSKVIEGPKRTTGLGDSDIGIEIFAPTRNRDGDKLLMQFSPKDYLTKALNAEQLQTLHTHSLDAIEPIGKMPVVIFSHGFGVNPTHYQPLLEEIASHGYLVLSLNHPSSSGYAPFSKEPLVEDYERLTYAQADNIRFVIDRLRNGKFKSLALPGQIILAGHSLGGAASILVSRTDPQIKRCINIDGSLKGDKATSPLIMPTQLIFADHPREKAIALESEEEQQLFDEMQKMHDDWDAFPAEKHTIDGIGHMDFAFSPLDWFITGKPPLGALKAHYVASHHMLHFIRRNDPEVLDAKTRKKVVARLAEGLSVIYIDERQGKEMAQYIFDNLRKGKYDHHLDPFAFKDELLRDMQSVCPDKHLDIMYTRYPIPKEDDAYNIIEPSEITPKQKALDEQWFAQQKPELIKTNFGIDKAEKISGTNIGYIKIDKFAYPYYPETFACIDKAMKTILDADALIIDLRENEGGLPETVSRVASYLFDKKQLLNQIYKRSTNETKEFYAEPEKLERVYGGKKPVYVLVGPNSFSAAEELAFDLWTTKRAVIIGQKTKGGAHPVRQFALNEHFLATIPNQKAINPITNTNWEGTGVHLDHVISEGQDALALALKLQAQKSND